MAHTTAVVGRMADSMESRSAHCKAYHGGQMKGRTPTSLRTIHGAAFSVSASGTDAGSMGPNGETLLLILASARLLGGSWQSLSVNDDADPASIAEGQRSERQGKSRKSPLLS